jgi:wobble nucleotide-excising tRNase
MARIILRIEAENLGPHSKLKAELENDSSRIGLYAHNGSGKTFLSRALRLYSNFAHGQTLSNINKMLSFGKDDASFKFEIENKDTREKYSLAYTLNRNKADPTVSKKSKYIFHVFNKDYVDENLGACGYSPSGEIEGYILGKDKIDLSKEEGELNAKEEKARVLRSRIENSIGTALGELKAIGVSPVTSEFKQITFDNVISVNSSKAGGEGFEILKEKQKKLKSMPDLEDAINFDLDFRVNDLLAKVAVFLDTKINKSSIANDFKQKVKSKQDFVESGVTLIRDEICPFCEQELSKQALDLIDLYNQYLEDAEAQEAKKARSLKNELDELHKSLELLYSLYNEGLARFELIKEYLPSADSLALSAIRKVREIESEIEQLKNLLEQKAIDVSVTIKEEVYKNPAQAIRDFYYGLEKIREDNEISIEKINLRKSRVQQEKTSLNKQLCVAMMFELQAVLSENINDYMEVADEIKRLENDIRVKKNKHKKEKKNEVMKTLEDSLKIFFGDKYSFDKKRFCLTFKDNLLKENAADVLSDGEKSIVAFCFYLADTHRIIKDDDDYKNLFFVIDDPISSMDFHYVYSVSQCIKSLNKYFPLTDNMIRFLILTHNLEFISILGRGKICTNNYHLIDGAITKARGNSALPYEEHLRDILKVSNGEATPSHTTPNSIRHILETINQFTSPDKNFNDFFMGIEDLKSDPFLYFLINDQSHGGFRSQPAYTPDQIKKSCGLVVEYIRKDFQGQLKSIN